MSQPEARIGTKIRKFLEEHGAFIFKVHGGPQMMAGLPDLVACINGRFVGIEVKQPGQGPSPRQKFVHSLILRAGGEIIVATSVDDVLHLVNDA